MEKFKGTPGPWRVGKNTNSVISDNSDGITISGAKDEEARKYYGGNLICESVSESNAQLIAAAPELLEALNKILSNFKSCIAGGNGELESDKADIEFAEKAIEKATEL